MKTKLNRFDPWPAETKKIIAKSHDVEAGYAKFVDENTVEVNGHRYQSQRIVVATGQHPHRLAIDGDRLTHTSTDVLSLKQLPQHVAFIGAGYVAMELATVLGAAGAQVTLIDHSPQPLKGFPVLQANRVKQVMEKRGMKFMTGTAVQAVEQNTTSLTVKTDHGDVEADYVVDASGRQPNTEHLHLEAAGIDFDHHGIKVDHHLQTTNPHVYAIGDVVDRPQAKLTPVAEFEGQYLFDYLEGHTTEEIHYPTIGTAAFTFPEIAMVGVNPDTVKDNPDYTVRTVNLQYDSLAAGKNDQSGRLTVVYHHGQLVGASEVSDDAADDINNFIPLIGLRISSAAYRQAVIAIYQALADKLPM